jgi:hypothetical protein
MQNFIIYIGLFSGKETNKADQTLSRQFTDSGQKPPSHYHSSDLLQGNVDAVHDADNYGYDTGIRVF